jgi:hypothetical protein
MKISNNGIGPRLSTFHYITFIAEMFFFITLEQISHLKTESIPVFETVQIRLW